MKRKIIPAIIFLLLVGASVSYWQLEVKNRADIQQPDAPSSDIVAEPLVKLPVVGSAANLKSLLTALVERQNTPGLYYGSGALEKQSATSGAADSNQSALKRMPNLVPSTSVAAYNNYSQTNVQVQGVDEADVVKTDGKYIYKVGNNKVTIAQAYPAETLKILSILEFNPQSFMPREIYVDDKYLVLIGSSNRQIPTPVTGSSGSGSSSSNSGRGPVGSIGATVEKSIDSSYPYSYQNTTQAKIYDLADRSQLKLLREVELDGGYISSRKIGANLYLTASKHLNTYSIMNDGKADPELPSYLDTSISTDRQAIPFEDIRYFPDFSEASFLLVGALNLESKEPMSVDSYLGAGQNTYASQQNLYVALTRTTYPPRSNSEQKPNMPTIYQMPTTVETAIYKFELLAGKAVFKANVTVSGTILNQYSMDESGKTFRIATTTGQVWGIGNQLSKNNVYILDDNLKLIGKLEDLAPGEKIYSTRFMGDRAYMVTFKNIDPLFVLDLKDPTNPRVAGALKIPGYSDYLHPYDETHIIGFGKDTVEAKNGGGDNGFAYYLGMKIALFDVSDPQKPIEMFKTEIGARGTDSELLHNPKALMFDKDKGLLAFPVTVYETSAQPQNNLNGMPAYGQFSFQGAYVYNIDLKKGFELKGKISHLSANDYQKSGQYWYDGTKNIQRILYIKDTLYTLSNTIMKANKLTNLQEITSLSY